MAESEQTHKEAAPPRFRYEFREAPRACYRIIDRDDDDCDVAEAWNEDVAQAIVAALGSPDAQELRSALARTQATLDQVRRERDRARAANERTECAWCGWTTSDPDREQRARDVVAHMAECTARRDAQEDQLRATEAERDAYLENLTSVQARCTELLLEVRELRKARNGVKLNAGGTSELLVSRDASANPAAAPSAIMLIDEQTGYCTRYVPERD